MQTLVCDTRSMNLDYLAGLLDADGHFSWRAGRYQAPLIGVTNTDHALMEQLVVSFGGAYSRERRACLEGCSANHIHRRKDIYRWRVVGFRAVLLCEALTARLYIKGDKAASIAQQYRTAPMVRAKRRETHMQREQERWDSEGWD